MSSSYEERRKKAQAAAPQNNRGRVALVASLVALLVLVGVGWAWLSQRNHDSELTKAIANATDPKHPTADGGGVVVNPGKAKPGAPTLVVYQDFQCPICKQVEDASIGTIDSLADQGKITLEYHVRTFLDDNMKRAYGDSLPNPDSSLRASEAALCADQAGKFREYHDVVFKNQPQEGKGYTDQQLKDDFAKDAGITGDALKGFQQCYSDHKMEGYAKKMEKVAQQQNNTGTPEFRLNGKTLDFQQIAQDQTYLPKAVEAATSAGTTTK